MLAFLNAAKDSGWPGTQSRQGREGLTMQGALQCAFPEMTERKAVRLSEILRGKGRGGEEASEENQVAFILGRSCIVNSAC